MAASRRRSAARAGREGTRKRRDNTELAEITAMLENDHRKVDKLFKKFAKLKDGGDESRHELIQEACRALKIHTTIEEELFYPAAREALGENDDVIDEAEVEHASANQLIADLEQMKKSDPMCDAKFTVLGEYISHHVEEEENEMFPKLRKTSSECFEGLLEQMEGLRRRLEQEMDTDGLGGKRSKPAASFMREVRES